VLFAHFLRSPIFYCLIFAIIMLYVGMIVEILEAPTNLSRYCIRRFCHFENCVIQDTPYACLHDYLCCRIALKVCFCAFVLQTVILVFTVRGCGLTKSPVSIKVVHREFILGIGMIATGTKNGQSSVQLVYLVPDVFGVFTAWYS